MQKPGIRLGRIKDNPPSLPSPAGARRARLLGKDMQLIDFFDRGAMLWPDRRCLVDETGARSYRDVESASHAIAASLLDTCGSGGFRAAVFSPNNAPALEAVLGILRAGGTWLPANARGTPNELCAFLLRHECRVLFFHSSFAADVSAFRAHLPDVRAFVCLDRDVEDAPSMLAWSAGRNGRVYLPNISRDDVAVIKPTGGTTGEPKSVMQTHGNFAAMTANFLSCMTFSEPPVHLVAAPMTYGAGTICFPLMAVGATHVLMARADPGEILRAIAQHHVNVPFLPPTVIYMMLAHAELKQHDLWWSNLKRHNDRFF